MGYRVIHYTILNYSCPGCGQHLARHTQGELYVGATLQKCRKCGKENAIATFREFDTLSDADRITFFWGHLIGLLIGCIFFFGVLLGFGLVALLSMSGFKERWGLFALCIVLPPLVPMALVIWRHWTTITRSRERMRDPAYREKVLQIMSVAPPASPYASGTGPAPEKVRPPLSGTAQRNATLGLLLYMLGLPLMLLQLGRMMSYEDNAYYLGQFGLGAGLALAVAGLVLLRLGLGDGPWRPHLLIALIVEGIALGAVCSHLCFILADVLIPVLPSISPVAAHLIALGLLLWSMNDVTGEFRIDFRNIYFSNQVILLLSAVAAFLLGLASLFPVDHLRGLIQSFALVVQLFTIPALWFVRRGLSRSAPVQA